MPELPEVETIVRQLDEVLPGKTIQTVEVLRAKSFWGKSEQLVGLTYSQVKRKQKLLVFEFVPIQNKTEPPILLAHLKMTGQLIVDTADKDFRLVGGHPTPDWVGALPSKHTRVIIRLADGATVFFNDMRVFGWLKIVTKDEYEALIRTMPPDVIDPEFTVEYLVKQLERSGRAVKLVILDQQKMGGMGNIYANDALWLARINPSKPANTLNTNEIKRLHKAMQQVLQRGVELGGASESTYKHINGMGGKYQEEFLIYKREGQADN